MHSGEIGDREAFNKELRQARRAPMKYAVAGER